MKDTTIAVGLAKNVFEIAISREAGKVSKQLRVSRPKLVSFFAKQSAATVLLEACGLGSLLGKDVATVGTRRRPAPTSPRKAVSTREQERPRGHQSFARGLPERGDSFGAHQVRAPAHPRRAPSPTLRMALHTDRTHQCRTRDPSRCLIQHSGQKDLSGWRLPAPMLEQTVVHLVQQHVGAPTFPASLTHTPTIKETCLGTSLFRRAVFR